MYWKDSANSSKTCSILLDLPDARTFTLKAQAQTDYIINLQTRDTGGRISSYSRPDIEVRTDGTAQPLPPNSLPKAPNGFGVIAP